MEVAPEAQRNKTDLLRTRKISDFIVIAVVYTPGELTWANHSKTLTLCIMSYDA